MNRGIVFLSRAFAIAMLLSTGMTPVNHQARTPSETNPQPAAPAADSATATRYEVRLRKLHLVRPDLIGYPIQYDVYC